MDKGTLMKYEIWKNKHTQPLLSHWITKIAVSLILQTKVRHNLAKVQLEEYTTLHPQRLYKKITIL